MESQQFPMGNNQCNQQLATSPSSPSSYDRLCLLLPRLPNPTHNARKIFTCLIPFIMQITNNGNADSDSKQSTADITSLQHVMHHCIKHANSHLFPIITLYFCIIWTLTLYLFNDIFNLTVTETVCRASYSWERELEFRFVNRSSWTLWRFSSVPNANVRIVNKLSRDL
jgi:hypothetical protein